MKTKALLKRSLPKVKRTNSFASPAAEMIVRNHFQALITCDKLLSDYLSLSPIDASHKLTLKQVREMVADKSEDQLAEFIDKNASMIQVDYSKLDFPSLLVYLCQRRGTKQYIGTMFKDNDLDSSGEISHAELQEWMMKTGKNLTHQQTARLLRSLDFDNNGKIEYREFLIIVVRKILVSKTSP